MSERVTWSQRWTGFDYGVLLPFLARLPIRLGRGLAIVRGRMYARLGRDWRQFTFNDQALHQRTEQAMDELMPHVSAKERARAVQRRYEMQSLDELEACWLSCRDMHDFPVEFDGLDAVMAAYEKHGRVVFVTAHYASCVLGVVLLGRLGIPVLAMTSSVTEDPRVHPAISKFYRKRRQGGDPYLNGGQVMDREGNSRHFVKFLRKGGAVIIFGELPPSPNEPPLELSFLGKERELASGPRRLAEMVKAPLISYICEFTYKGFKISFSVPDHNPYELIEQHIQAQPSAWWAADLLPMLPLGKKTIEH